MSARLAVIIAAIAGALIALGIVGERVLAHDRRELYERFAADRRHSLQEAGQKFQTSVADIGEDLQLASSLLASASSPQFAERELDAIATIKREYYVMAAPGMRVVAYNCPEGAAAAAQPVLDRMLDGVTATPGKLVSAPGSERGQSPLWYRVYASRPAADQPPVAALVDMSLLFARLDLQRNPNSRALVKSEDGIVTPVSDSKLASLIARQGWDPDPEQTTLIDGDLASELGLPRTTAVITATTLYGDGGQIWKVVDATSTTVLASQERLLVRRVFVGAALVLLLLLSAGGYVIHNARRAAILRERLHNAGRIVRSEKLVTAGQLAAGIAHEVGTPLNVARGRLELVMSHLGKDHAETRNHQIVIDQIDHVTRLIQQLLDYVRPSPAAPEQVDLSRVLRGVAELLGSQASKRDVKIDVSIADGIPPLRAVPDQVQQIVVNLVLNAIDACDDGGRVRMHAEKRGAHTVLEVSDDGHGIPPDVQAQVFDPFFTTKKRGQGTGLGLWVVAQLGRATSGEIELTSAPGEGTTVRVSWPVPS